MNESKDVRIYEKDVSETLLQSVELCFLYIDSIKLKVFRLVEGRRKNDSFDEKGFFEVIDMLDNLISVVSDIYRVLKKYHFSDNFCVKTVQSLEIQLLFVLKALFAAKHKKDFFMLMDLLEHELTENIVQWKIKIVPELKKIKRVVGAGAFVGCGYHEA